MEDVFARVARSFLALAIALGCVSPAGADVLFTYGFSPRTMGMGNAFVAVGDDASASYYNPGAIIQSENVRVSAGYLYAFSNLTTKFAEKNADLGDTQGIAVGVNLPIPLGSVMKDRIWFGFVGFFPNDVLLSIRVPFPTDPQYVLLQNSGRSVSIIPTLGFRLIDGLGIGGGAQLFDNTAGEINAQVDATGEIVTTVGQELPTSFAPIAGIFWAPGETIPAAGGIRFGFTYRREFFTNYKIPVNTFIGGIPLSVKFEAVSLYTPDQFVLGFAYFLEDRLKVSADASYNRWSTFPDPNLQIDVDLTIPLLPITFRDSDDLDPDFHDTVSLRAGCEWKALDVPVVDLFVRGGYFYDPSPVPGQKETTNYLDTDRHVFAASPGIVIKQFGSYVLKTPISIDLGFQYHHLVERVAHKRPDVDLRNPGYPKIGVSGSLFSFSAMIGSEFDVE